MRIPDCLKAAVFFAAAIGVPATAAAAEILAIDASSEVTTESRAYRLTDDHLVVLNISEEKIRTEDETSPIHGATATCFGRTEIVSGVAAGDGYCSIANPDGSSLRLAWTVTAVDPRGEPRGHWTVIGGEGPFEGATGGGSWGYTATEAPNRKTNTITGVLRMK